MAEVSLGIETRLFARGLGLAGVLASGFLTAFLAQASSPDYHRMFWSILPLACLHLFAAAVYFRSVRHWHRWVVFAVAVIAAFSFAEMAVRIWL